MWHTFAIFAWFKNSIMVKNLLKGCSIVFAAALVAMSCEKIDVEKDLALTAEVSSEGFDGITVKFTAGKDAVSVQYACGSQLRFTADSLDFENGKVNNVLTAEAAAGTLTVKPAAASPAAIFLRAVSSDGKFGKTVILNGVASPVKYTLSKVSLGSFVYTVDQNIGDYEGISILAMSEDAPAEWEMTAEELVDMYAGYGMLEPVTPGKSAMVELNGEHEQAHIAGVVYWNADFTYEIKLFNFKSGRVVDGAKEATVEAKVENITAESADLVFTPGEATCGYFYTLYTLEKYNATRSEGESLGQNPDTYIRDLCSAAGSMNWEATTDSRTALSANTEYVLVCYPYNVNGSEGWGEEKIVKFTTAQ